jgi:hypothetical protein
MLKLLVAFIVSACSVSALAAGAAAPLPLIPADPVAAVSRRALAETLYNDGVERERAGSVGDAVRLWTYAFNLDSGNETVSWRLSRARETAEYVANTRYKDALLDLRNGRPDRAGYKLGEALAAIKGAGLEMEKRISDQLAVISNRYSEIRGEYED